jgi:hypothetical protein
MQNKYILSAIRCLRFYAPSQRTVNIMQDEDEASFTRREVERIAVANETLDTLCKRQSRIFLPLQAEAAAFVAGEIINFIRQRTPASLIRVGDAEGNAIGLTKPLPTHPLQLKTFNTIFFNQNGISLGEEEARSFARTVREALLSADIIGFRSFDVIRVKSELQLISRHIENGEIRGALGILYAREFLQHALEQGIFLHRILTSAWIHLGLIPHLQEIMSVPQSVIIISGRPELKEHFARRLGERLRTFIAVPVDQSRPKLEADSHYRNQFPQVIEFLKTDLRGTLVLVGAGLFGKIYCHVAKQSGAVAIDIGSAFDILAGKSTRPVHSTVDIPALRWVS